MPSGVGVRVPPLALVNETERACVDRFVALLVERVGPSLDEVWLFGSAARGDMWSRGSQHNSDIDLLVVSVRALTEAEEEELLNETYPLYLECGRQISPTFRTRGEVEVPSNEMRRDFFTRVFDEGRRLHPGENGGRAGEREGAMSEREEEREPGQHVNIHEQAEPQAEPKADDTNELADDRVTVLQPDGQEAPQADDAT